MNLTFAVWNTLSGGTDSGSDARLRRQMGLLASLDPSIAAIQECKDWNLGNFRTLHLAERLLGMRGFLAEFLCTIDQAGGGEQVSLGTGLRRAENRPGVRAVSGFDAHIELSAFRDGSDGIVKRLHDVSAVFRQTVSAVHGTDGVVQFANAISEADGLCGLTAADQGMQPELCLDQVSEPISSALFVQHACDSAVPDFNFRPQVSGTQKMAECPFVCGHPLVAAPPNVFLARLPPIGQRGSDQRDDRTEHGADETDDCRRHRCLSSLKALPSRPWESDDTGSVAILEES